MLASKHRRGPQDDVVLPAPRQRLFAQLNVRVEAELDARFKRYCLVSQRRQAQVLADALDSYLKAHGF